MQSKRAWIWIAVLVAVALAGVLFYRSSHTPPKTAQESSTAEPSKTADAKRSGGADVSPTIVAPVRDPESPAPDYPTFAMRRHQEGAVFLGLHIGRDGKVKEAKILKSSGFSTLDMAALDTVSKKWRYTPATRNGKPVAMWHKVKITFACEADGHDTCKEELLAGGH